MFTKKEKVLVHPWTEKRFLAHRRKVHSAGPAIDYHPPAVQPHVTIKLKKTQRELERQGDIQRENTRLLQSLTKIMNTSRMNNFWRECRPNFLHREAIYPKRPQTSAKPGHQQAVADVPSSTTEIPVRGTSGRCPSCSGRPVRRNQVIPEERVPWEPPRKSWNRKLQQTERVHKCCIYCC